MKTHQIAAQLFTVRDHCKTAPDFAASMKKLRAIGYQAVQISGVGPIPPAELKRVCDGEGLVICATHESGKTIVEAPQAVIDRLGALGCAFTAYPHPHVPLTTREEVLALAKGLDAAGAALGRAGLVLTYHNHALELRRFGDQTILDLLYDQTGKRNLQGEIDTYWIQTGGGDPVAWCRKLRDRLPLLHLKDQGVNAAGQVVMMEIGNGNLDWPRLIAAAEQSGCKWFIVEQDTCPGDPFDSLKSSFDHLTSHLIEGAA